MTSGPGLAGALLVGITYAKALAFATNLPLIAVNHLEGHIHAVLLNERESPSQLSSNDCHPERSAAESKDLRFRANQPGTPEPVLSLPKDLDSETWETSRRSPSAEEPALALVVSGGHTHLYLARPTGNTWQYTLVGRTLDDAAGEAYDKVAKLLGLGYPGGPWIDALAQFGNPQAVPFAFSQVKTKLHLAGNAPRTKAAKTAPIANLDRHFLFSFSGIKTAVLRYVELHNLRPEAEARRDFLFLNSCALGAPSFPRLSAERVGGHEPPQTPKPPTTQAEAQALCSQVTLNLIASFQYAVVGDLLKKTIAAAESLGAHRILVSGGVAANRELRQRFTAEVARRNLSVSFPTLALSTDNAAMIAAAAWPRLLAQDFAAPELSADPSLALGRGAHQQQ